MATYTAKDITVLQGLEPVRKRLHRRRAVAEAVDEVAVLGRVAVLDLLVRHDGHQPLLRRLLLDDVLALGARDGGVA